MTATRSSTRKKDGEEAPAPQDSATGSKHKLETPEASETKRGKTSDDKEKHPTEENVNRKEETAKDKDQQQGKEAPEEEADTSKKTATAQGDTAEQPKDHNGSTPSNILEKGIIYFFFRGRVNVDEPSDISDIARSYIILRPIAHEAGLGPGGGAVGDASSSSRLIAVPKKVLPRSGRDRWTAFVEKAGASFAELKERFLAGAEYSTKTVGERHIPAASPAGEGVYAITRTGRESHLVYVLTLPEKLGEVQKEIGLKEKGSFVISTKNPKFPGPSNTQLPKAPEYPEEVQEEFRDLRWMPSLPKHLDFPNTQFILIGESSGIEKATEPQKDQKEGEQDPKEEIEQLEEEDLERMKNISSNDSARIYEDLHADAKQYPKLQTTF
ncbi:hypothetical protein QBC33DRAFT_545359 [Phialemonium atrogriseum]|uniref:BTB domain transcription factor n=1 Tax=Phialemonium atrogriseum TaxID=1093897 RepID=A0AAJ0BUY8_9PEZI|nr:uncharacterized protein QBC33DRAFT_545359 [Phialemonium atrogriseum]KAK1764964.1 hypothetical protein QBC33DRAFT_545359 [Phialemonium atrogriseum]